MSYLKSSGPPGLAVVAEELEFNGRKPSTAATSTMINLSEIVIGNK